MSLTRTMPPRRPLTRSALAVIATTVTAGALALPAPASASVHRTGESDAGKELTTATLQLTSPEPAVLARLAQHSSPDRGARLSSLQAATPTDAQVRSVEATAAAAGLEVTGTSDFAVTVSGSTDDVQSLLGSSSTVAPDAFKGQVATTTVADAGVDQLHSLATLTGTEARTAYHSPSGVPSGSTSAPTIATLQFSGWDDSALTSFAERNGLEDPVSSGRYTPVSVDGASTTNPVNGGDVEVALDQEALLTADPSAHQRAYFAPNSDAGEIDALNEIAGDASSPDSHLTALSISWGDCERDYSSAELTGIHTALSHVLAAGVTVFAASGDNGAYDCTHNNAAVVGVDYPAADPLVVGVGGTTLSDNGQESSWYDANTGDGGGGGYSTLFPRPSYQASVSPHAGRAVPDIALDANPATGLRIVVSGNVDQVGGTSLASPLAAATFTDLLTSSGVDAGIGDIHRSLYGARTSAFGDVTSGTNGAYRATVGFDVVTGRGVPHWSSLAGALLAVPSVSVTREVHGSTIALSVKPAASAANPTYAAGTGARPASCRALQMTSTLPGTVRARSTGRVQVWVASLAYGHCAIQTRTVQVLALKTQPHQNPTTTGAGD